MNKKTYPSVILSGSLISSFLLSVLLPVYAANSDTVAATVTAEVISVSLDQALIPFGVVPTSDTKDTTTGAKGLGSSPDYTVTATNDGSVTEDFHVQASDGTDGSVVWTLDNAGAGVETYTMKYCVSTCDTSPTWFGTGEESDSSYAKFADDIETSVTNTQAFDLQVGTPTSTASVAAQSITITVMATAVDGTP